MKKTLFLLLICTYEVLFSQKNIIDKYSNYFENTREIPFLHLNKTNFLKGEEIWFKAYIQEQNSQKLHPTTTNLYVSIFSKTGVLKNQQLVHIKNGTGKGNILLDSTFTDNSYYIKASTKWMKNFKEDNAYYQKINIASTQKRESLNTKSEKDFFEFQLLPEGGNLIANTINNIGVLIKNSNNKGVRIIKGIIKDQDNNIIRQFTTNQYGMNSVKLFIKENQFYTFSAYLADGSQIKATTSKPFNKGITLNVINNNTNKVIIIVRSNKKTIKDIINKRYRIMIHNTRSFKNYYFSFQKGKQNYAMILEKEKLFSGMNVITLFNENNKPISERLTFINDDSLFQKINIKAIESINDSIKIRFSNPSSQKISASVSFLPAETKAYQPKNNIVTNFLLKPYIKGQIESPIDLFSNKKDKKQRNLDLLLLTQGWSKYNWNTIFKSPSATLHPFENGIDITARINKPLKEKQAILVYSKDNNLVRIISPNENPWILKNSFIKKNTSIDFALKDNKGNLYKVAPALSYSTGKMNDVFNTFVHFNKTTLEASHFAPLESSFEVLDEVEIQANKREKEKDYKVYGASTMHRRANLEDMIINSGETVIDFLKFKNYQIIYNNSGTIKIIPRGLTQFEPYKKRSQRPLVSLFLDGNDISNTPWLIEGMYLDTIKEIFFGRNPGAFREEIHIFTLPSSEYVTRSARYTHILTPLGFATEKEYYTPKYPSFIHSTYKNYGSIFWEPNITLQANSIKIISSPTNMQNEIILYIEGITESGKLISKKHIIYAKQI